VRHPALSFTLVNRINETLFKKRNERNYQNYDPQIKGAKTYLPSKNEFNSLGSTLTFLPDLSFPILHSCKRIMPHLFFFYYMRFIFRASTSDLETRGLLQRKRILNTLIQEIIQKQSLIHHTWYKYMINGSFITI